MQRAYEEEAKLFASTGAAVERQRLALHAMAAALGGGADASAEDEGADEGEEEEMSGVAFLAGEHGVAAAAARVSAASEVRRDAWRREDLSLQVSTPAIPNIACFPGMLTESLFVVSASAGAASPPP